MDVDRTAEAIQRYLLDRKERVQKVYKRSGWLSISTNSHTYDPEPADWAVAGEDWVADALRVAAGRDPIWTTHGLLLPVQGEPLHLNRPEVMAKLGRRVGVGLNPLAYAELFGELYSWKIDGPVVYPFGETRWARPGWLVREADHFAQETVVPDAPPVAAPTFKQRPDGEWTLSFYSHNRVLLEWRTAVNIYTWTVTGSPDRDATWERQTIADMVLEAPPWERPSG
ncbi:hypothetical protein [Micromonospora sp. NPDC023737]|uniref:hypothetical protein n=1 Tax=unclassified Micromonospora TaxID=2617518 RepID=UPI0033E91C8A